MDFSSFNTKYTISKYQVEIVGEKQYCNEACIIKKGSILFPKTYFITIRFGSTSLGDLTPVVVSLIPYLVGIYSKQVGFFKREARRGQHHYFQIIYRF